MPDSGGVLMPRLDAIRAALDRLETDYAEAYSRRQLLNVSFQAMTNTHTKQTIEAVAVMSSVAAARAELDAAEKALEAGDTLAVTAEMHCTPGGDNGLITQESCTHYEVNLGVAAYRAARNSATPA